MLPHAVIVPGEVTLKKSDGEDWKVTDCSNGGAIVDAEVWVTDWVDCVEVDVLWVTD